MKWLIEEDAQIHSPGAWASRNEETARVLRLYLSAELVELYCAFPTASHCFFNVSLLPTYLLMFAGLRQFHT